MLREAPHTTAHQGMARLPLLLVEDDVISQVTLQKQLQSFGYEVTAISDANTALQVYRQNFFPLILTDLGLPGMDGLEFCQHIRALPEGDQSIILVLTAWDQPKDIRTAIDIGVDDYLVKPVSQELLRIRLMILERQFDVRERRRKAEQELRASEQRLAKAQSIGHLGNWEWDITRQSLTWSNEIYRIFGVEKETFELTYEGIEAMIHPNDRQHNQQHVQRLLSTADVDAFECRIIRPDGRVRHIYQNAEVSCRADGSVDRIFGIMQDVTERKQVEGALRESREQLRNLSLHVEALREEDRTTIAREIHDELGQALTALKIDVSWLKKHVTAESTALLNKIAVMEDLIDSTLQSVKRISTQLRPGLLDDLGLSAAIEWQTGEFQQRTDIRCDVRIDPAEIIVNTMLSTAVFRIFQEALTNVVRHAQATHVQVVLTKDADTLMLDVRDNGIGITTAQIANPKSFGLIGIRERVQFLGGQVTFQGSPNEGTTVTVTVPL